MLQPTIPPPPTPSPLKPVKTNTSAVFSNSSPITTTGSGSLYHLCHSVLDRLSCIEGMSSYIEAANTTTDPLSKLTLICRQGYPLCTLYNALQHVKTISVETDPNLNARNSCKSKVYHFLVACRNDLLFPEEDMFTISDLYQDDTNGFVKVKKKKAHIRFWMTFLNFYRLLIPSIKFCSYWKIAESLPFIAPIEIQIQMLLKIRAIRLFWSCWKQNVNMYKIWKFFR